MANVTVDNLAEEIMKGLTEYSKRPFYEGSGRNGTKSQS